MSAAPKQKFSIEDYIEFDKNNEGRWEYLLAAQDRPHIMHYVRQPDGNWLRRDIEGIDGAVKLTSVECELTLAEVYRQVEFSSGDSQPSAE